MKIDSINIKIIEPNSTMGNILKRYEIIIKAISISNAWHALNLTKQGTFGFLTNPANKIINNKKPPKGNDFSIISIWKVSNNSIFKKEYLQNKKYPKGIDACNGKVYKNADEILWNI